MNARLRKMLFAVIRARKAVWDVLAAAWKPIDGRRRGKFPRRPCPLCGRSVAWTAAGQPWARHRCQRKLPFTDLVAIQKGKSDAAE